MLFKPENKCCRHVTNSKTSYIFMENWLQKMFIKVFFYLILLKWQRKWKKEKGRNIRLLQNYAFFLQLEAPRFHCETTALWEKSWGRGSRTPAATWRSNTKNKNTKQKHKQQLLPQPTLSALQLKMELLRIKIVFYSEATGGKRNVFINHRTTINSSVKL